MILNNTNDMIYIDITIHDDDDDYYYYYCYY